MSTIVRWIDLDPVSRNVIRALLAQESAKKAAQRVQQHAAKAQP
jgi:hypothetical protein